MGFVFRHLWAFRLCRRGAARRLGAHAWRRSGRRGVELGEGKEAGLLFFGVRLGRWRVHEGLDAGLVLRGVDSEEVSNEVKVGPAILAKAKRPKKVSAGSSRPGDLKCLTVAVRRAERVCGGVSDTARSIAAHHGSRISSRRTRHHSPRPRRACQADALVPPLGCDPAGSPLAVTLRTVPLHAKLAARSQC